MAKLDTRDVTFKLEQARVLHNAVMIEKDERKRIEMRRRQFDLLAECPNKTMREVVL